MILSHLIRLGLHAYLFAVRVADRGRTRPSLPLSALILAMVAGAGALVEIAE